MTITFTKKPRIVLKSIFWVRPNEKSVMALYNIIVCKEFWRYLTFTVILNSAVINKRKVKDKDTFTRHRMNYTVSVSWVWTKYTFLYMALLAAAQKKEQENKLQRYMALIDQFSSLSLIYKHHFTRTNIEFVFIKDVLVLYCLYFHYVIPMEDHSACYKVLQRQLHHGCIN